MNYTRLEGTRLRNVQAISEHTGEANEIIATNDQGELDESLVPSSLKRIHTEDVVLEGEITSGDLLYIFTKVESGLEMKKAKKATLKTGANGFAPVFDGDVPAEDGIFKAHRTGILKRTTNEFIMGEMYYAGNNGEAVTEPNTDSYEAGDLLQEVGIAISTSEILFQPRLIIEF